MPTTTGKSLAELQQMRSDMMAQGKQLSTSKSLGKVEQAIKVLNPTNYSAEQVASAQHNLKLINEPTVSGVPTGNSNVVPSGLSGGSSGSSNLGFNGGSTASIDLNKLYEQQIDTLLHRC